MDGENRPFDRVIKQVLARPRVLLRLCRDHVARESGYFDNPYWDNADVHQPITWLEEEFRPVQELWRADKIARVGESTIIHVEQQTKHDARVMAGRMMHYAAYISHYYDFRIRLFQVYYYTGDPVIDWKGFVQIDNRAILNEFTVIDAGAHDAWAMLRSNDFDYALLGLMARKIGREDEYLDSLISLAKNQNVGGDLIRALVDCVGVALLRDRADRIFERLSDKMVAEILKDPIYQKIREPALAEGVTKTLAVNRRIELIKQKVQGPFPIDFLDWAVKADSSEMESLEVAAETAKTFDELVAMADVSWALMPRGSRFA